MQYLGSKRKVAKILLQTIEPFRPKDSIWVEPFVGGANMIQFATGQRIGNDSNPFLISLFKALQNGWTPPDSISKEEYFQIRTNKSNYPPELVAFVGFLCSFGGKWFGGYAVNSTQTNYATQGKRSLLKQLPLVSNVDFCCGSYLEMEIPENSIIYCDPPYQNTTSYKDGFNHVQFWNWVRKKSQIFPVFVSEYTAPSDFECLIEIPVKTVLNKSKQDVRVERLFRHKI